MIPCPICSFEVADPRGLASHFRHQAATHPNYGQWCEEQRFGQGSEPEDYVTCLACGHRAETLARHLKASHGITADQYKTNHPGALIRCIRVTSNMGVAAKSRDGGHGKGHTKTVTCPGCGIKQDKSKFLVVGVHDFRCIACKQKAEDARWVDKQEGDDYVQCLECGYRAENLTSHVQNAHHDYRANHPNAPMVALMSAVRDKTAIRGVVRSPEFGQKIREAKLLGFTLDDFTPYLESDGTVDHRKMLVAVGCALPTLQRYMDDFGLVATKKYIEAADVARRVNLTAEQLHQYKLGNGKVSIAKTMSGLGLCNITIKKECRRLGLTWAHGNVSQRRCLDAVSKALDGLSFEEEWKSWRFVNPPTGHRFRFDGYFPDVGLVVEFQGMFHYTFPNPWMIHESYRPEWNKLVERDRIKREMITNAPDLTYLEILEDEPYTDIAYLTGRLVQAGVLEVRPGGIWFGNKLVRPVQEEAVR